MSLDIYQSPVSPELPDSLKSPDSPQSPVSLESTESHDLPDLGKTSFQKTHFLSGIARKGGGGLPMPKFVGPFFTK